jgi:hypothetical protein
MGQDGGCK